MKSPPQHLQSSTIISSLAEGWSIHAADLDYMAVGFGSHHWSVVTVDGEQWYVTVDDLQASHLADREDEAFASLDTAFRTAAALRDVGRLRFVVGPVADQKGRVLRRLGRRYAISVFPFLEVETVESGEYSSDVDRFEAMELVGRIHTSTGSVPLDSLRRETLAVQDRDQLVNSLHVLDEVWTGGPYAETARKLLRAHARQVQAALRRFDTLAALVMRDRSDWVITHGEPHAANVIRTRAGDMVMVDWDTVALGPRERDLWMLIGDASSDWTPYSNVTGITSISEDAIDAYRLHWSLSEIAVFTGWCRAEHERTGDMDTAWAKLEQYVKDLSKVS